LALKLGLGFFIAGFKFHSFFCVGRWKHWWDA